MIQHSHLKVEKLCKIGHKTCSKQACVVNIVTFNGLDKKTGLFAEMEQSHLSHKLFCKVHSGEFPTVIAMFEMTRARNQELEEQGEEEEEEEGEVETSFASPRETSFASPRGTSPAISSRPRREVRVPMRYQGGFA